MWQVRGQKDNKIKRKRTSSPSFGLVSNSEGRRIDFRERKSNFSLDFPAIGQSVPDEPRGKVAPHCKSYAWVPVLRSFDNFGR